MVYTIFQEVIATHFANYMLAICYIESPSAKLPSQRNVIVTYLMLYIHISVPRKQDWSHYTSNNGFHKNVRDNLNIT